MARAVHRFPVIVGMPTPFNAAASAPYVFPAACGSRGSDGGRYFEIVSSGTALLPLPTE